MVFGRNYDWVTGNGMVCTNQRGLSKTSDKTKDGETISWVSQYGSITFNQYGKEFPTGGMNEKGLVVELMWLDGTIYPPAADKRPAIEVLQWIQYQLDNCSTIEEVIATDKKLRISSNDVPLHYLVADAKANAATIEFLNGKMVVHKGNDLPFPVLTNDTYERSIAARETGKVNADNSLERFTKACNMVQQYQNNSFAKSPVDYSFDILGKVKQGDYTKWSIVYDISNKKIFFKTSGYSLIKNVSFSAFDFNCMSISKAWDMNQVAEGDVAKIFGDFSLDLNSRMVNRSFDESSSEFTVSEEDRKAHWQYPGSISCLKASN